MVDYEFQARRIGRMSDYIDRRTATLGLHMACLEQQARELRRDAENMRCVVIGDSVDDPARMAEGTERLLGALRRLASCMEAVACARTVLHVFENVDKDKLRDENADMDGTCQWRQADTVCGNPTVEDTRWCAEHVDRWNGVRHLTGDDESQADDNTTPYVCRPRVPVWSCVGSDGRDC